jgi:hypothetical protein
MMIPTDAWRTPEVRVSKPAAKVEEVVVGMARWRWEREGEVSKRREGRAHVKVVRLLSQPGVPSQWCCRCDVKFRSKEGT